MQAPATFHIPPAHERRSVRPGQGVKLLFDIEALDERGSPQRGVERMWVVVSQRIGDRYLGILDNEPSLEGAEGFYLRRGVEVPFGPEHIADISDPPSDYAEAVLRRGAIKMWPR